MLYRRAFLCSFGLGLCAFPVEETPDFRGTTLKGEKFTKSSLKGTPVLIQFWATWCGVCRRDQPAVDALVEEYGDRLTVLAVSVNESERVVRKYLANSPRKGRIVLGGSTNLPAIFGANAFPHYVLLDAESRLKADVEGGIGDAGLHQLLKRVNL
ncbi:TlpA family protein disulfide reductase [Paludibaculum fermentans]|uniref:TlpA family protein disulfide reductase n=1 Tax=Paludibaculum fermentans TaxID=1473598 RepID=A0A7S7NPE8_PALFE|nr:TlpA disulfide reductase family protein [Paludibaculum fermentans]QOY87357.1 TlpA family protein disulfide reductase [Paludibaculum fermentans]